MFTNSSFLPDGLTASDVMKRGLATIPREASLRDAARRLHLAQVSGAPVVDEQGRFLGVLSASDFVRWAAGGCPEAVAGPARACRYQVAGRLLTGQEAVICTLAMGGCHLQAERPTLGGGHVAICLQPTIVVAEGQQLAEGEPEGGVAGRYMTTDVDTVGPHTLLEEAARIMVAAHVPRVFVLDEQRRPVGVVSSTDLLEILAQQQRHALDIVGAG